MRPREPGDRQKVPSHDTFSPELASGLVDYPVVGLVFVTIWFRHDPLKLAIWQLTASIFLYLSWFAFAYFSARQSPLSVWALELSAPFQVAFVLVAGILIVQIARRHRERRATSSPSSNAP
jgi:hypothetical protein